MLKDEVRKGAEHDRIPEGFRSTHRLIYVYEANAGDALGEVAVWRGRVEKVKPLCSICGVE